MKEIRINIAPPYSGTAIEKIRRGFEKRLGEAVEATVEEDGRLIGGFIVYADGKIYDASIKTQLSAIEQRLKEK